MWPDSRGTGARREAKSKIDERPVSPEASKTREKERKKLKTIGRDCFSGGLGRK